MEILLVEDNPNDAELAGLAIERARFTGTVTHVEDGVRAVDYLLGESDRLPPRVVLLDLKMPRMNGIEVLERLKADARARQIPVVMLTSSRELADITRCYELGVNSYVVKPVDFDAYQKMISELIDYWIRLNQPAVAVDGDRRAGA